MGSGGGRLEWGTGEKRPSPRAGERGLLSSAGLGKALSLPGLGFHSVKPVAHQSRAQTWDPASPRMLCGSCPGRAREGQHTQVTVTLAGKGRKGCGQRGPLAPALCRSLPQPSPPAAPGPPLSPHPRGQSLVRRPGSMCLVCPLGPWCCSCLLPPALQSPQRPLWRNRSVSC